MNSIHNYTGGKLFRMGNLTSTINILSTYPYFTINDKVTDKNKQNPDFFVSGWNIR